MNQLEFKQITLQGFKSFAKPVTYEYASTGLCQVVGENKVNPQLAGNAAGKTTLLVDGILWILFGKTATNLKAGDIHSWQGKHKTKGTLLFNVGGVSWLLTRTWSPNTLTLQKDREQPHNASQEEIEQLLGINMQCLLHSMLIGQFGDMFFDLKPAAQMQLFTDLLDLRRWEDRSNKANIQSKTLLAQMEVLKRIIATAEGKIESQIQHINTLKEQRAEWEQQHTADLEAALTKTEEAERHWQDCVSKREAHKAPDYAATSDKLNQQLKAFHEERNELLESKADLKAAMNTHQSNIAGLQQAIKRIERLGPSCTACLQTIPAKHKEKHIAENRAKIEQAQADFDAVTAEKIEVEKELENLENRVKAVEGGLREITRKQREDDMLVSRLENAVYTAKSTFTTFQSHYLAIKNEQFTDRVPEARKQLSVLRKTLKADKAKLLEFEKEERAVSYWVKGFAQVRLYIVRDALTSLEIEVNNAIQELGLHGWSIKLDVERENKSGGVTKGFKVFIKSPESGNAAVPWEAWSGGEKQRLRVAGTLGLSNLIRHTTGLCPNIEVWDEPTTHMTDEGVTALVGLLNTRAKDCGVYLIDHHVADSGEFASTLRVTKDESGSTITSNISGNNNGGAAPAQPKRTKTGPRRARLSA